ncbi:MAG: hypothetical protein MUF55_11045 [Hydrogenophaga sp.]|jgi:hypothetical protein|nr:hypothetical protein [Hydrogenophaga sp.]
MRTYRVTRRADGAEVYRYQAEAPVEWSGMEFATHDHTLVDEPAPPAAPELPASAYWLYPGPFKDRLGVDALALAVSTHPVCVAAMEMLRDRKYVDLRNPKTIALMDMLIAAGQPSAHPAFPGSGPMTPEKKAAVLGAPATDAEVYRG